MLGFKQWLIQERGYQPPKKKILTEEQQEMVNEVKDQMTKPSGITLKELREACSRH